jgi:hypothetical protein
MVPINASYLTIALYYSLRTSLMYNDRNYTFRDVTTELDCNFFQILALRYSCKTLPIIKVPLHHAPVYCHGESIELRRWIIIDYLRVLSTRRRRSNSQWLTDGVTHQTAPTYTYFLLQKTIHIWQTALFIKWSLYAHTFIRGNTNYPKI